MNQEEKLERSVRRVFGGMGVPPLRHHAGEILVRTLDPNGGSSKELVRIIQQDLGLATQVLRLANSVLYNHSGRAIVNIAHAVTLLGWLEVRSIASSARPVEDFANGTPGLRELVLASTLTAAQSRGVAATIGYPRPEEAYLGGLVRNLGEVLVACHYPIEYARVIQTMEQEKIPERAACIRVFDFSWDAVGTRVAAGWNMPAPIQRSMQAGALYGSPADRSLASITNYGHNLTCALYRQGAAVENVQLGTVLDPTGRTVPVSLSDRRRIVDSAEVETRATFSAAQVPLEALRLSKQAERARVILQSISSVETGRLTGLDQVTESAAVVLSGDGLDLTRFISGLLDAMLTAGFERAVFGLMNETRTSIRGRLASGGLGDDLLNRFQFPLDGPQGPIRAALQRKQDIYVNRARDGRYDGSALVAAFDPGGFALLPIVIENKTVGCLYADLHGSPRELDAVRPAFGRVRDLIAQAIGRQAGRVGVRGW